MMWSIRGIVAICVLASGCVANPETLCSSLIPPGWLHVAPPPGATSALSTYLPSTPYTTGSGHLVRSIHTLWFQQSNELIACTLDKRATDTCSIETTEFDRTSGGWVKVSGNAVLCNVAITHGGK